MKKYYILNRETLEIETFEVTSLEHIYIDNIVTFTDYIQANKMRDYLDTDIRLND